MYSALAPTPARGSPAPPAPRGAAVRRHPGGLGSARSAGPYFPCISNETRVAGCWGLELLPGVHICTFCRGFAPQEAAVALLAGVVARVRLDG
jgi:hypothetical protein